MEAVPNMMKLMRKPTMATTLDQERNQISNVVCIDFHVKAYHP